MTLRVLVVDDHDLARLRELVEGTSDATCVGEARDGPGAVEAIDALRPDLVLLDVRLPGCSGLEVLERSEHRPPVVFTTAHAEHAVDAFELEAIDFLLKPFGRARFQKALERVRVHRPVSETSAAGFLQRIFVPARGRILRLDIHQVERCEADGDYVAVWADRRRHTRLELFQERAAGHRGFGVRGRWRTEDRGRPHRRRAPRRPTAAPGR